MHSKCSTYCLLSAAICPLRMRSSTLRSDASTTRLLLVRMTRTIPATPSFTKASRENDERPRCAQMFRFCPCVNGRPPGCRNQTSADANGPRACQDHDVAGGPAGTVSTDIYGTPLLNIGATYSPRYPRYVLVLIITLVAFGLCTFETRGCCRMCTIAPGAALLYPHAHSAALREHYTRTAC